MTRRRRRKRRRQNEAHIDRSVPTYDHLEHIDLDDPGAIDQALDNLIHNIETGYFLQWEAVVRQERGLRLTQKQEEALGNLIYFGDDADDRILYIDEIPRPKEPWYEIARKIIPRLLEEPFRTDAGMYWAMYEGWPTFVETLETHGQDLPLPQDADSPLEIFPVDLRHRLWLQTCFDALSGLGQDEELTLANKRQRESRMNWLIQCLREHKDTVKYFDLTLEKLLTKVIMPPQDEKIFVDLMRERLDLASLQEPLTDSL